MTYARTCWKTRKRCYGSVTDARRAMARASNRVRVYLCQHCHLYHVTDQEKP